jgi:patatin-like phospholipase/acyl hydrolase
MHKTVFSTYEQPLTDEKQEGSKKIEPNNNSQNVLVPKPLTNKSQPPQRRKFNVLCLDGGGMRGLVECGLLRFIEQRTGKPIDELFDMIVGVSTGAILASMLCRKMDTTEAIRKYYFVGSLMFEKRKLTNWIQMFTHEDKGLYDTKKLEALGKEIFGTELFIDPNNPDPKTKVVVISSELDEDTGKFRTVLFRNYIPKIRDRGADFQHVKMYQAISASAAAPFYLNSYRIDDARFFDGGILHNNPTLQGLMEARIQFGKDCKLVVLSLGTGDRSAAQPSPTGDIAGQQKKKKNMSHNLIRLLNVCSDTERIHRDVVKYIATSSSYPDQIYYRRFSPPKLGDISLATYDESEWSYLLQKTEEYVKEKASELEQVCKHLLEEH